jgi:hypothetical protein
VTLEAYPAQTVGPLPGVTVALGSNQSIPSGATTPVLWDTATPNGPAPLVPLWSAANSNRFYADRSGWWLITAWLEFQALAGGSRRQVAVRTSSGAYLTAQGGPLLGASIAVDTVAARHVWMAAGDWVEVTALQDSGSALPLQGGYCAASWGPVQGVKGDPGTSGPLPGIEFSLASSQNVASGAWAAISWPSVTTHGPAPLTPLWTSGQPTRFYADRDGWWQVSVDVQFGGNAGGNQRVSAIRNSAGGEIDSMNVPFAAAINSRCAIARTLWMSAGDWIEVCSFQDSGVTLQALAGVTCGSWQPVQGVKGDKGEKGDAGQGNVWTIPWTALPFASGYTNYGSPFDACLYAKDTLGIVYLRGLCQGPATAPAQFAVAATLPANARPQGQTMLTIQSSVGMQRYDIYTDGSLKYISGIAPAGGLPANAWINWHGSWWSTT